MTVKNGGFDYYRSSFCDEGSVSPNASSETAFASVPRMLLPLSTMSSSSSKRQNLIHRLRQELQQLRSFQKDLQELPKCFTSGTPCSTATMLRMKQCLKRLMSHQYAHLFNTPVDVLKLNIPDYFTIIKHPMDLGTVKHNLFSGTYSTPSHFSSDVRLTFSNAMTYNPPGNPVYLMADTLSKFFELRWKTIENKPDPLIKKRKMNHDTFLEPAKLVMADEDRVKLARDLGSLTQFPVSILNFLRDHSSNAGGGSGDDELEIDINDLTHDALFQLRDLLDEFFRENHKKFSNGEPCELELLHGPGPGSSLIQHYDGSEMEDEDVDIGYNEQPESHISPVRTEKDKSVGNSSRVKSVPDYPNTTRILSSPKLIQGPQSVELELPLHGATSNYSPRRKPAAVSGLGQLEDASNEKQTCVEGEDCLLDGNSAQNERQLPPEKLHRAALLKNQYADLILKARERTFNQNEKGDPEKMRREREELELQKKKEKARLQAEVKEAEEARRKAEAEAAAEAASEAKRKLELEREAARKALLEMEKSVEINENSRFFKDLELLKTTRRREQMRITREEDGFDLLGFGGSNPLEQLGLFMKHEDEDEDEEETEPLVALPDHLCINEEVEEGEID